MMYDDLDIQIVNNRGKHRFRPNLNRMRTAELDGFVCVNCHVFVSAEIALSGVQNRNHCPYCLWSRHLDLHKAGDRLSACKARMSPVGLSIKRSGKRYGNGLGELMIVHHCMECDKVSANRIAADDVAMTIFELYERSLRQYLQTQEYLKNEEVTLLGKEECALVKARLFGSIPDPIFNQPVGSPT